MKYRPSAAFLVCVAVVLSFAGIAAWFWSRLQEFPIRQWRHLTFAEIRRGVKFDQHGRGPEQIAADRARLAGLREKMLTEFPDLVIHWKPVPDERNGFLNSYKLAQQMQIGIMRVSPDLSSLLKTGTPWDAAAMRAELAEHRELVERIESIAAMPSRSQSELPKSNFGFHSGMPEIKLCADVLIAKARLAAEAKDEEEALRLTASSLNLASHLDQVEAPTFSLSSAAMLLDFGVGESVTSWLLPALGPEADLPRWRAVLASRPDYTPDSYSRILPGEWQILMDSVFMPYVLMNVADKPADEAEAFYRALSSQYVSRMRTLSGQKAGFLLTVPRPPLPAYPLSAEMRRLMDIHWDGSENWGKGYARAAATRAMTLAALDLLILEKSGTTPTADSVSKVALDPISGEAFSFDPQTRTLTTPPTFPKDIEVKSVTLPW